MSPKRYKGILEYLLTAGYKPNAYYERRSREHEAHRAEWNAAKQQQQAEFKKRQKQREARKTEWLERQASQAENRKYKEALIREARRLAQSSDWKHDSAAMRSLMAEWKAIGSAGAEHHERLWEEFNSARQTFYDRMRAFFEQRQSRDQERER